MGEQEIRPVGDLCRRGASTEDGHHDGVADHEVIHVFRGVQHLHRLVCCQAAVDGHREEPEGVAAHDGV